LAIISSVWWQRWWFVWEMESVLIALILARNKKQYFNRQIHTKRSTTSDNNNSKMFCVLSSLAFRFGEKSFFPLILLPCCLYGYFPGAHCYLLLLAVFAFFIMRQFGLSKEKRANSHRIASSSPRRRIYFQIIHHNDGSNLCIRNLLFSVSFAASFLRQQQVVVWAV